MQNQLQQTQKSASNNSGSSAQVSVSASTSSHPTNKNQSQSAPKPTPEIRYDVFYPVPSTSSLNFHPKFASLKSPSLDLHGNGDIERRLVESPGLKSANKGSKQRHKLVDNHEYEYDDDDYYDDYGDEWLYDELSFEEDYNTYDGSYGAPNLLAVSQEMVAQDIEMVMLQDKENEDGIELQETLGDFDENFLECRPQPLLSDTLEHALDLALIRRAEGHSHEIQFSPLRAGQNPHRKRHHSRRHQQQKGGRYFYQTEVTEDADSLLEDAGSEASACSGEFEYENSSSLSSSFASSTSQPSSSSPEETNSLKPSVQFKTIPVRLPRHAMSAESLRVHLGPARYTEAECMPRKVVVDVTDRVVSAAQRSPEFSQYYLPSFDFSTVIVLTYLRPAAAQFNETGSQPQESEAANNTENASEYRNNSSKRSETEKVEVTNTSEEENVTMINEKQEGEEACDMYGLKLNSVCFYGKSCTGSFSKRKYDYIAACVERNMVQMGGVFSSVGDMADQVVEVVIRCVLQLRNVEWYLSGLARPLRQEEASCARSEHRPDFSTLAEVNGWKTACVSILDVCKSRQQLQPLPLLSDNNNAAMPKDWETDDVVASRSSSAAKDDESSSDERAAITTNSSKHENSSSSSSTASSVEGMEVDENFCGICFEELAPLRPNADCLSAAAASVEATALRKCGHWFCDACWRTHLLLALREGAQQPLCPGYRCTSEVDAATLLAFVHVSDVIQQRRRGVEAEVLQRGLRSKWCPNHRCGRVLQLLPQQAGQQVRISAFFTSSI
jgi:hypothetical protein